MNLLHKKTLVRFVDDYVVVSYPGPKYSFPFQVLLLCVDVDLPDNIFRFEE
jgi:hypothetical protein